MNLTLHVWRQKDANDPGRMVKYQATGVEPDMSFLEMLDVVNQGLIAKGEDPIAFDSDCREGICGMCDLMINGRETRTVATSQLPVAQDAPHLVLESRVPHLHPQPRVGRKPARVKLDPYTLEKSRRQPDQLFGPEVYRFGHVGLLELQVSLHGNRYVAVHIVIDLIGPERARALLVLLANFDVTSQVEFQLPAALSLRSSQIT